jgi:hypothetical protein
MHQLVGARARVRALSVLHATIAESMACCLHEPPHRAGRLAWRAIARSAADALGNRRRFERLARGEPFASRATRVEHARLVAFARWAAAEPAPKVVASIHSSDLASIAFEALVALPPGMRVHMPVPARSVAALAPAARLAERLGKSLQFLPLKTAAPNRLRKVDGRDVLFMLLDLDARYGRAADVALFDRPARIVVGPYVLARRLRASIVYLHRDGGELEIDPPHDGCVRADGEPIDALAAHFARRIERSIACAPTHWSRWHTWPRLCTTR